MFHCCLPSCPHPDPPVHTVILMGLTGAFQDFSFEIQLNLEYLASNRLVRYQGGVVEKFAGFSQSYFYSLGLKCTFIIYQFQYFSPISSHQSYSSPLTFIWQNMHLCLTLHHLMDFHLFFDAFP